MLQCCGIDDILCVTEAVKNERRLSGSLLMLYCLVITTCCAVIMLLSVL